MALSLFPTWWPRTQPAHSQLQLELGSSGLTNEPPQPPQATNTGDAGDGAPQLEVALGQHWLLLGDTGRGKTTFMGKLAENLRQLFPAVYSTHYKRYVRPSIWALDSKFLGDFDRWPGRVVSLKAPALPRKFGAVHVWQQPGDDNLLEYDKWLSRIRLDRRPGVLLIDELSALGRGNGQSFVPNLALLLKQARAIPLSVVVCSQEAAYIPRQTHSQISHLVRFGLENPHDQRRAAQLLGMPEPIEPRKKFGFFYCNLRYKPDGRKVPIEYDGWQEFF